MALNQNEPRKFLLRRRQHGSEKELHKHHGEKYQKKHSIAKGSWGVSDKIVVLDNGGKGKRHLVMTFVPRGARITERLRADILSHHKLTHPHLVNIVEVFCLPSYLAIAKEYVDGCDLLQLCTRWVTFKEQQARWFFQQIVVALDYLHRKDLPHKELKLENALIIHQHPKIKYPVLKLTGFKLAMHERLLRTPTSSSRVYEYMAPENWGKSMRLEYDGKAADMWALGVCLYKMLFGDYPFPRPRRSVHHSEAPDLLVLQFPEDIEISADARTLIEGLLAYEISDRMTVSDVRQHPWFLRNFNPAAIDMNDKLLRGWNIGKAYQDRQKPEAVQEVLEEARTTDAPEKIWADTNMDVEGERDDHQDQMMSPDECEDHVKVMDYPNAGMEFNMAE